MNVLELRVPSARADEQTAYYADVLGLPRDGNGLRAGASLVCFEQAELASPLHFAFNIPENRIEDARRWAAQHAPLLAVDGDEVVDFPAWNAHAVYFLDPEGNIVELIARHDLPNASTEPFSARSLLAVSEAGVPTTAVADAVDSLGRELGAELYDGDRAAFAAVGDAHGLFIVVPVGRKWFPTSVEGLAGPIEATVRGDRDTDFELPGTTCRVLVRDR